jgi:hypothetical protein
MMAKDKKSFIAYFDWKHTFNELPDEKAGQLIKHVFAYVNGENPESDDMLITAVFANIKQTLIRDDDKYKTYIEKQSVNGAKGGATEGNQTARKTTQTTQRLKKQPKQADSDSDSDNVIQLDIEQIDNYILELKEQTQFLEGLYMTYKLKDKIIGKLALRFKEHLKMFPKQYDSFMEYRNHFGSWVRFKIEKGELGEFLKHQKGEL